MRKNLLLSGLLVLGAIVPADAAVLQSDAYMEQDTTYDTGSAVVSVLGVAQNTEQTPVPAQPWYSLDAGYYLPKNAYTASMCPPGKYCPGAAAVTFSSEGDQGIGGDVAAGYYSSGGATKVQPGTSDCVGGKSCGSCDAKVSGYGSYAGAKSFEECYKAETIACSTVFPITATNPSGALGGVTGAVYTGDSGNYQTSVNYTESQNKTTAAVNCTSHITSSGTAGTCVPDDATKCLVRAATCQTGYSPTGGASALADSERTTYVTSSASSSSTVGISRTYNSSSNSWSEPNSGTFSVTYANNSVVKGVWAYGTQTTGDFGFSAASANNAICFCQIETFTVGGKSKPMISQWFRGATRTTTEQSCGDLCVLAVNNLNNLNSAVAVNGTSASKIPLYNFYCRTQANSISLYANGGSGKINNKTVSGSDPIVADCSGSNAIASSVTSQNPACAWSSTNSAITTNLTKTNSIFLGWAEYNSCTAASCLTSKTCGSTGYNDIPYYAAWGAAECVKGTGVADTSLSSVSANAVVCSKSSLANYYCPTSTETGVPGVASLTVTCTECAYNWSSNAGSTRVSDCKRSIVLNKNGGSGRITVSGTNYDNDTNGSITCSYNTPCDLPSVENLTLTGHVFTGAWGTTPDCTDVLPSGQTISRLSSTSTASTVTYYACKTTNDIFIKWTGVDVAGDGFTAVSGESNAYTSTVSYGGTIKTPTSALVGTGQQFLGWKFKKN